MVYHVLILPIFLVLISGCTSSHSAKLLKRGMPMQMGDIYRQSVGDAKRDTAKFIQDNLKVQQTYGYVKPYIPVIQEPIVRKVWVPDQKSKENKDLLIGGHWVYLMIQGPRWFIEGESKEINVPVIVPGQLFNRDKQ